MYITMIRKIIGEIITKAVNKISSNLAYSEKRISVLSIIDKTGFKHC